MSNCKVNGRSPQAGFTLTEMVIAVMIVSILSASVLPAARAFRHKAAVAAAQNTAHCLETALTGFDPYSSDPLLRYPLGIDSDQSLATAAQQLGCNMGPTASHPFITVPVTLQGCVTWYYFPDGTHVHRVCSDTQVSPGAEAHYQLTLGVPGFTDRISISSMHAMETIPH